MHYTIHREFNLIDLSSSFILRFDAHTSSIVVKQRGDDKSDQRKMTEQREETDKNQRRKSN